MVKKITAVIIALILSINLSACSSQEKTRYEAEFLMLFDTITQIVGYSESKEEFADQVQMIHDNLEEYHQLYDIYNGYDGINNMKTINDQAGIAPVEVDRRIIDMLLFSKEAYEMSDGKINVAFGAVLKIWHDYRDEGIENPEKAELPPVEMLMEAAKHTDISQLIIDEESATVFLADSGMSLDVGAIAKGYAVEEISKMALDNGLTSALISVGGNVRSIGVKADSGARWTVGIKNPLDVDGKNISRVELEDASLVTSGIYERYYTVNGRRYHHIIDPVTLFPAEYFASVSILCPDSGLADALSTSVFTMPFEQGLALIESLPDTEAVWVFHDGEIRYSSNYNEYTND
ncbi:MAG: FAD:protein FMN transferase [Eubacteriales bacterium]|nr:FAD:protein FMN transferase [Eubacteriales bacterium]